jgi:hypothetical protein
MTEGSATATCRHCGKRFTLSRYGNRTTTSRRRLKHHRFCKPGHRVAHHRRMAALKGGGLGALQDQGGAIPKGSVTEPQNQHIVTSKINDLAAPKTPQKTTLDPHFAPREWLRVYFEDEAPTIGSGLRLIAVDRLTPQWVRVRDHTGRTAKLAMTTYANLKPVAFGRSAAMTQYETRFPNAADNESALLASAAT